MIGAVPGGIDIVRGGADNMSFTLEINREESIDLQYTDDIYFPSNEYIYYRNYTIYNSTDDSLLFDINTLYFCDAYRIYRFDGGMLQAIHGPGVLFFDDTVGVGIFFVRTPNPYFSLAVSKIDAIIHPRLEQRDGGSGNDTLVEEGDGEVAAGTDRPGISYLDDGTVDDMMGSGLGSGSGFTRHQSAYNDGDYGSSKWMDDLMAEEPPEVPPPEVVDQEPLPPLDESSGSGLL